MENIEKAYVFFDFDGTLTRGDSLMPFLRFIVGDKKYFYNLLLLSPILLGYFLKLIKNDQAKEKVLQRFLNGIDKNILQEKAKQFVYTQLPKMLRPEGIEKLQFHQQNGDKCILVSASLELYLKPWADLHGFFNIIGTKLEIKAHQYTGKIAGKNCYGIEKVIRIRESYGENCWQNSYAYSDSLADRPLLEKAAHSFLWKKNGFTVF